jgi:hypothetical protein
MLMHFDEFVLLVHFQVKKPKVKVSGTCHNKTGH